MKVKRVASHHQFEKDVKVQDNPPKQTELQLGKYISRKKPIFTTQYT